MALLVLYWLKVNLVSYFAICLSVSASGCASIWYVLLVCFDKNLVISSSFDFSLVYIVCCTVHVKNPFINEIIFINDVYFLRIHFFVNHLYFCVFLWIDYLYYTYCTIEVVCFKSIYLRSIIDHMYKCIYMHIYSIHI